MFLGKNVEHFQKTFRYLSMFRMGSGGTLTTNEWETAGVSSETLLNVPFIYIVDQICSF